jgi:hypothetical protein
MRSVLQKRTQRCESNVAGPRAVVPLNLEMSQKRQYQRRVHVRQRQVSWAPTEAIGCKLKKQAKRIAIARYRLRAHCALLHQPVDEEVLKKRRERRSQAGFIHGEPLRQST